jgi:hypothetical protein
MRRALIIMAGATMTKEGVPMNGTISALLTRAGT